MQLRYGLPAELVSSVQHTAMRPAGSLSRLHAVPALSVKCRREQL
jgi:hypothetical protein